MAAWIAAALAWPAAAWAAPQEDGPAVTAVPLRSVFLAWVSAVLP